MDQVPSDWEAVTFTGAAVGLRYPTVTPQGQTVERVEKQAQDHRGDIERVHQSSPDPFELYIEVVRFRDPSPQGEYERHKPHLEQRFGAGSVTQLTEKTDGQRKAWAYAFQWDEGERSVLSFQVAEDTYRVIWNPLSDLNSRVVGTFAIAD
jgi:hypothetical protein